MIDQVLGLAIKVTVLIVRLMILMMIWTWKLMAWSVRLTLGILAALAGLLLKPIRH